MILIEEKALLTISVVTGSIIVNSVYIYKIIFKMM